MLQNMGTVDRIVRVIIAVMIGLLYYFGYITGVLAIVLGVVAAVFVLTALVGTCPLYMPFGFSTNHKPTEVGR